MPHQNVNGEYDTWCHILCSRSTPQHTEGPGLTEAPPWVAGTQPVLAVFTPNLFTAFSGSSGGAW